MLVISYVPLLVDSPFQVGMNEEQHKILCDLVEERSTYAGAKGCAWVKNDGVPSPILILDKGDDVVEHLVSWSEGKPSDWFNLVAVATKDGGYNIVLMPRLDKSIARHVENFGGDSAGCKVLSMPLSFAGKLTDASRSCLESLPSRCRVGFLDEAFTLFASVDLLDHRVRWLEFDLLSVYDNMNNVSLVQYFGEGQIERDFGGVRLPFDYEDVGEEESDEDIEE